MGCSTLQLTPSNSSVWVLVKVLGLALQGARGQLGNVNVIS
jgi:hypothetical protein